MKILVCSNSECSKSFERSTSEANRNKRLNRLSYCSISCKAKVAIKSNEVMMKGNPSVLINNNRKDEFSPFKRILFTLRQRSKENSKKNLTLTLQELKEVWDRQEGKCPFTGWNLLLPKNSKERLDYLPERASLDRIDSSKGYSVDNVQFVSMIYQFAKNSFSDDVVLNFCRSVINNIDA
jgi:hypothetical protein